MIQEKGERGKTPEADGVSLLQTTGGKQTNKTKPSARFFHPSSFPSKLGQLPGQKRQGGLNRNHLSLSGTGRKPRRQVAEGFRSGQKEGRTTAARPGSLPSGFTVEVDGYLFIYFIASCCPACLLHLGRRDGLAARAMKGEGRRHLLESRARRPLAASQGYSRRVPRVPFLFPARPGRLPRLARPPLLSFPAIGSRPLRHPPSPQDVPLTAAKQPRDQPCAPLGRLGGVRGRKRTT